VAYPLIVRVADGLAALHQAGIVHRDIKADNVLITEDGRPVIADFGLAMTAEDLPALPNGVIGTPAYMAPEAILGITETFEQYAAADQYSLAVTTYYALTGTLPFDAPTPSALFYAQMAVEPDPASRRRPELPDALDVVLRRALAKRPADRFEHTRALRDALYNVRISLADGPENPPEPLRDSGARSATTPALRPTIVAA
jgi:eukaryotic-like serine/threonine-protein kinase